MMAKMVILTSIVVSSLGLGTTAYVKNEMETSPMPEHTTDVQQEASVTAEASVQVDVEADAQLEAETSTESSAQIDLSTLLSF